jgi:hypothetical protein
MTFLDRFKILFDTIGDAVGVDRKSDEYEIKGISVGNFSYGMNGFFPLQAVEDRFSDLLGVAGAAVIGH